MRYFSLSGTPVGKGRARVTHTGHAFTPKKTRDYENAVKIAYLEANKDKPPFEKDVPLKLVLWCGYPIPKSDSKKKRADKLYGITRPTVKPDLSNVLKSVEDALNGIAYSDDSQITELCVCKFYAEYPVIHVWIETPDDMLRVLPMIEIERTNHD